MKENEIVNILRNISKTIPMRIVGSFVLKKHKLISRDVKDIDVVVTSNNDLKKVIELITTTLGLINPREEIEHEDDMYPHFNWKEVLNQGLITDQDGTKICDILVNQELPEADESDGLFCSKHAVIRHKKEKALLVKGRSKDLEDYFEILKLKEEEKTNILFFLEAKKRISSLGYRYKTITQEIVEKNGSPSRYFFSQLKENYGLETALEYYELEFRKKYPSKMIEDILFLVRYSGVLIPELVWES